jgi:hypothetical protein
MSAWTRLKKCSSKLEKVVMDTGRMADFIKRTPDIIRIEIL